MFDRKEYFIEGDCYSASLSSVPWDSATFDTRIFDLSQLHYANTKGLDELLQSVEIRAVNLKSELTITRVKQSDLVLIHALEAHGYRYIEANYQPKLHLDNLTFKTLYALKITKCTPEEVISISEEVGDMFKYGRYHQDLRTPNELADARYKNWLVNALESSNQTVYKCIDESGATISFFVVETGCLDIAFLSLVGMLDAFRGKGMAKSVWNTMIKFLQDNGIKTVSTSISSHNIAVFNLYVSLGFSFPEPELTFHKWHTK